MRKILLLVVVLLLVAVPVAAQEGEQNVVEIAASNEDFSTLVTAIQLSGLGFPLSDADPITVFAPTNEAFDNLFEQLAELGLAPEDVLANRGLLRTIVSYHVIDGLAADSELVLGLDGEVVDTAQGEAISIAIVNDGVVLNDSVNVIAVDIQASNGVIHVVDEVLIPPSVAAAILIVEAVIEEAAEPAPAEEAEETEEAAEPAPAEETEEAAEPAPAEETEEAEASE